MKGFLVAPLALLLIACQDQSDCSGGIQTGSVAHDTSYEPVTKYSYYSPGTGTVNIGYGQGEISRYGEDFTHDIVVMAQFASMIIYFDRSGSVRWTIPSSGRTVDTDAERIYFRSCKEPGTINVADIDGTVTDNIRFASAVAFFDIVKDKAIVGYLSKEQPVEVYSWDGALGDLLFTTPENVKYPRGAALHGNRLAVADTFGHRIHVWDMESAQKVREEPFYYPNDVDWRDGALVVTEEHMNRLVNLDIATGERRTLFAPPYDVFWNEHDWREVSVDERVGEGGKMPRSLASDSISGIDTLYAPNALEFDGKMAFVADTDNARVVMINGGVVGALMGINNPVDIAVVR